MDENQWFFLLPERKKLRIIWKKQREVGAGMEPKRVDKVNYYLNIADAVLERSTCLRRHYGAIIVRNDEIVSTLSLIHICFRERQPVQLRPERTHAG